VLSVKVQVKSRVTSCYIYGESSETKGDWSPPFLHFPLLIIILLLLHIQVKPLLAVYCLILGC
jgi:hypothetical protein